MPIRPLDKTVISWPDRQSVDRAVRRWAAEIGRQRPEVVCIGYFGSYARGDWGVGSDLDIVLVVKGMAPPPISRSLGWDTRTLPVPADVLVYTVEEWQRLQQEEGRFAATLTQETVWVYPGGRTPEEKGES
ncbi:nucleotidyltransferase domain-containing protein [Litorilinea aerophila]|uniref:Nucleotidyltransferase domain-containing protein n=1 Tax=Litorilinea aerophila TaxID=1204385 RepID=A0A540VB48_9CHLR|nr:nucleotidyltransferase domain-containing protein [Litorilinea aerophila]MCC9078788.1 nucleotidyltransferase domain-containing protein [Litorilinea aerophila]OUC07066.1 DNA polymerase [Litorilinea aerophila]